MVYASGSRDKNEHYSSRDKQIICGLFLAKFDREALAYLGFESFTEAFNALGLGIGARPASIKNYRDEFDPVFPNPRQGWHKREMRDHCKETLQVYGELDLDALGQIVKIFFFPEADLTTHPALAKTLRAHEPDPHSSFAQRLETGQAAEQYFLRNVTKMTEFDGCAIVDTTRWGCGFDFMLTQPRNENFLAVEVKGLSRRSGSIRMTALEYDVAETLAQNYFLVVVYNFFELPSHVLYQGPFATKLDFKRSERREIQISWSAKVSPLE